LDLVLAHRHRQIAHTKNPQNAQESEQSIHGYNGLFGFFDRINQHFTPTKKVFTLMNHGEYSSVEGIVREQQSRLHGYRIAHGLAEGASSSVTVPAGSLRRVLESLIGAHPQLLLDCLFPATSDVSSLLACLAAQTGWVPECAVTESLLTDGTITLGYSEDVNESDFAAQRFEMAEL
jgi:hypothetical protein